MARTETGNRAPAYVSFAAFTRFIDWVAGLSQIPDELPRSQWPRTLQGGTGLQLAAAVRFLGLFEGDRPTAALRSVAVKDAAGRKAALATLVRDVYGSAFANGLESASLDDVERHLESLGTTRSTHRRAVSFFINAARAADLPVPAELTSRARIRRASTPDKASTSRRGRRPAAASTASANGVSAASAPRKRGRPPGSKSKSTAVGLPAAAPSTPSGPLRAAATVPAGSVEDLRIKYIETLMARLEAAPDALDGKLLDRIERLLGFTPELA